MLLIYVMHLSIYAYIYRSLAEITQFTDGMDEVFGLWKIMKANAKTCIALLCHKPTPLSKYTFMALFETKWSEEGTNSRSEEQDTIYSWEIFIQDIEGNCNASIKFMDG